MGVRERVTRLGFAGIATVTSSSFDETEQKF